MKVPPSPFAELVGLSIDEQASGRSTLSLRVAPRHLNPHGVVHGAVLYALADTGMGAALYPTLSPGEICATIEIKISYFRPVWAGAVGCRTEVLNRGKTVANLDSRIYADDELVAQANGHYAIIKRRTAAP